MRDRKFRFALNLLGILIGCAAITGLISLTQGLSNNVAEQLEVFGPTNIVIIPGDLSGGPGFITGKLDWRDLDIIRRIKDIKKATPIIANKFTEFTVRGRMFRTDVYGVTEQYAQINTNTKIEVGRNLVKSDAVAVIIGSNIAQPVDLDERLIDVGDRIKIKSNVNGVEKEITLRVVGILAETGGGMGANLDDSISISLKTAQSFFEVGGEFDFIMAQADNIDVVNAAADAIEEKFNNRVTAVTPESAQEQIGSILGSIQSVLGGIAGISLVVAGVGIINTMTVSVMERTKEIGILKAIGAKSYDVMLLFLSEAMITGIVGGTIGAGFGFSLGLAIGSFIDLSVRPTWNLGIQVVVFAMGTSIISGLYPAWRASKMNPVEALRHE